MSVGCRTNYFGHDDDWAPHAPGLKSIRDAIDIRERILLAFEAAERSDDDTERRRLTTFVVIGGGPTGVEMAGAISELGRQVLAEDYRRVSPDDIRVVLVEMQQGKHVAEQIRRDLRRQTRKTFVYADRGIMATIGRSRAVVQASIKLEGFFAWLAWCFVHIILLMSFRNRAIVLSTGRGRI